MGTMVCFRCMRSLDRENELSLMTRTCEKCFNAALSSRAEVVADYLDSLRIPAALIAQDQTVISSNGHFRSMSPDRDIVGRKLGEVLECMYSPILGRCGDTVACLLCRLKRSVERTWTTGEGLRAVPFSFPHKAEGRKTFTITTEVVRGAVLLLMGSESAES
jgi:hypothetical protein